MGKEHVIWEQIPGREEIRILRMFGNSPYVRVPALIAGHPVTELGSYCFAPKPQGTVADRIPKPQGIAAVSITESHRTESTGISESAEGCRELSGSYLTAVELPDTVTAIGSYAFYNCRKLEKLVISEHATDIGTDAFMNCSMLRSLFMTCSVDTPSGLRQILSQISWDIEVSFYDQGLERCPQAVLFYPEYFETMDEIAPAHIFGRKISGEGFRARQSFKDGMPDFAQYDTIFQKASAEESVQTMCRIIVPRLRDPIGLTEECRQRYEEYVCAHGEAFGTELVHRRLLLDLELLYARRLLTRDTAAGLVQSALKSDWAEGAAALLQYNELYYGGRKRRYEFEEFYSG